MAYEFIHNICSLDYIIYSWIQSGCGTSKVKKKKSVSVTMINNILVTNFSRTLFKLMNWATQMSSCENILSPS